MMLKEGGRFVGQVSDVSLFTDLPDHEQVFFLSHVLFPSPQVFVLKCVERPHEDFM